MGCAGPKSGKDGKYLSHSLKAKGMEKGRESLKENPAFGWVKMQAKKSPVLPKHKKSIGKGKQSNLPPATGVDELTAIGKA